MSWTHQLIHCLDFEGGASAGVVEYGMVTLRGAEIVSTNTRRCRPVGRMRREDVAVHGLAPDLLAGEDPFSAEFERMATARESGPLAAHFSGAEHGMLKKTWPYPRPSPDFTRPGEVLLDWGPWVDTGRLYEQLYPELESLKLADLVSAFGLQGKLDTLAAECCPEDRRRYHAALYDALAAALLLRRLADEPQIAGQSLTWLLLTSTRNVARRDSLNQERYL